MTFRLLRAVQPQPKPTWTRYGDHGVPHREKTDRPTIPHQNMVAQPSQSQTQSAGAEPGARNVRDRQADRPDSGRQRPLRFTCAVRLGTMRGFRFDRCEMSGYFFALDRPSQFCRFLHDNLVPILVRNQIVGKFEHAAFTTDRFAKFDRRESREFRVAAAIEHVEIARFAGRLALFTTGRRLVCRRGGCSCR